MKNLFYRIGCALWILSLPQLSNAEETYRWPREQPFPPAPAAEPPILVVPQTATAPTVDGDISDDCWKTATTASILLLSYEGLYAAFPTEAKLMYDASCLYVGFDCVKKRPEAHTALEYSEVLLVPPGTAEFYKAAISEKGKLDTSIWGGIPIPSWQGDLEYAARASATGWTAEFSIPFKAMGVAAPAIGDTWKANLGRRAALGYRYNVAWATTYAWFYEPRFFGQLRFGGPQALSAEFQEIEAPRPNRNPLRLNLVNRGPMASDYSIEIALQRQDSGTVVFADELTIPAGQSLTVPAFYDLSDGGRQMATVTVRGGADDRCLLRQSVPSHFPSVRTPYLESMSILRELSSQDERGRFQDTSDRNERERLFKEAKRLEPSVLERTATRETWESLQDPVETLLGQSQKLAWWIANQGTLSDRAFAVGYETTLRKLLRNQAYAGSPVREARIAAARGEYEALQLVVISRNQSLGNVQVEVSSLQGPGGDRIPAENVECRWVDFVRTRQPHCPVDYIGWYPDPLLPGTPRTIPEGTIHQPIWVTVQVPRGIQSGDYRGEWRVCADGQKPWSLEFIVHVYDFDLPRRPALQTSLWLHNNKIAQWYGWETIPEKIRREQYAFLLEHRINPTPIMEPYLTLDDLKFCLDLGLNAVQLGFAAAAEWPLEQEDVVTPLYRFLKDRDLLDLAYIYAQDEPSPSDYTDVRDTLDKVNQAYPGLRRVCTASPPAPGLEGYIDTWVVGPNLYNYAPVAERVAADDELWLYLSASVKRPFANWYIDYTALENRLITWHCWKYGATGLLYWGINEWHTNLKPWTGNADVDAAISDGARWPEVPWNTRTYLNSNGEAQLVYPGPDGVFWSSVRLEIIRDAIEDYDYFAVLAKTVDELEGTTAVVRDRLRTQSNALLDIGSPLVHNLADSTMDPNDLLKRRHDIAQQIERNLGAKR